MAKLFHLEIMTPERQFFDDDIESLTFSAPDGQIAVLADHVPLISPVIVGSIRIIKGNEQKEMFSSEGFVEVHRNGVLVFVQACEWPDEIDARRAEEARKRAEERMRQKQSINEYKQSKIALARAMARLSITKNKKM